MPLPIRHEAVEVGALLERVRARFDGRARSARARRSWSSRQATCWLDADPVRLEQAVGNLVDNALEHGLGPVRLLRAIA